MAVQQKVTTGFVSDCHKPGETAFWRLYCTNRFDTPSSKYERIARW
jgi:hypothetical protein